MRRSTRRCGAFACRTARPVILSDTVGFISDLPTHLVAAFRATLEEVVEADLIIHLRDISDPDTAAQAEDVESILATWASTPDKARVIEVWNKIDLLDDASRERLRGDAASPRPCDFGGDRRGRRRAVGSHRGAHRGRHATIEVTLKPSQLGLVDWLYKSGDVVGRVDGRGR